jgi:hypothetical protein
LKYITEMKSLLLRFWRWLGRLLGQDTKVSDELRVPNDELRREARPSELVTPNSSLVAPVTLPPTRPPQMDLHTDETARYSRKASLLTQPEGRLYRSLLLAVESEYQVMSKVRLWDFIWLENDPPERGKHLGRLSSRHVDFLLCEPLTLKPLLAIELDDYSHKKPEAIAADRYKDELFVAAGLPLLRLPQPNIPPRRLREQIQAKLSITSPAPPAING